MRLDPFGYETNWLAVDDGLRLAYQVIGEGPTVVLSNGLGGTFHAWRHIYLHLAERYRVVSWDFRGTHGSDAPRDRSAITVPHHVDDLQRLLEHWGVDRALFLGWSMGVQVNFELYRREPQLFAGIGVINGTAGRAFDPINAKITTRYASTTVLEAMQRHANLFSRAIKAAIALPGLVTIAKRFGLVAPSLDEDVFHDVAMDFADLDFELFGAMLESLGDHDAWDVLPNVDVPVTVMAGDKDIMTPVESASRMSQILPDARLVVVPGGTHYAPLEAADIIIQAVDELIERCGY
ncbi:MAG: alpha/beta hydrolase [Myxococcota bacterium]